MKNKIRKKSSFIGLFSLFGISSLTALTAASCATAIQGNYYDFVSFDPSLSGNLAILGFKPTSQSLYNSETEIPDYVKNLNIPTESGVQPSSSNAETWLLRNPGIAYSFNWVLANAKKAENYGFKNLILWSQKSSVLPSQDFSANYFPIIASSSAANPANQNELSKNAATAWDYQAEINDLAQQLDSMVKNKDGSSIFGDITAKVNNVTSKLNEKIAKFKSELTSENKQPKISFWGKSYGPNYVIDSKSFKDYGPSSQLPGWLYSTDPNLVSSLNFLPAVPKAKDNDLKFGVFSNGGFNTIGWKADTGEYSPEAVQDGFANSSDYVFVQMPSSLMDQINDPSLIDEIKESFAPMVDGTDIQVKKNKVFVVPYGISLSPYNLLGIDYTINLLANNILGPNNDVTSISAFDLSNLKILSSESYDFI